MLRPRDPRVVPVAAHSRRHASVKEWVDKIASLFELEAFPIGWCLLDHLASRDDKTLGLFAMRFFGNPPIEYFADGVSVDNENLVYIAPESWCALSSMPTNKPCFT
jgi:hypothetical protein